MSFIASYNDAVRNAAAAASEIEAIQSRVKDDLRDARRKFNRAFRDAKRLQVDQWIERCQMAIADGCYLTSTTTGNELQVLFITRKKKDATITCRSADDAEEIVTVHLDQIIGNEYQSRDWPNPTVMTKKEFVSAIATSGLQDA